MSRKWSYFTKINVQNVQMHAFMSTKGDHQNSLSDAKTTESSSVISPVESVNSCSVLGGVSIPATACCSIPSVKGPGPSFPVVITLAALAAVLVELFRRWCGRRIVRRRVGTLRNRGFGCKIHVIRLISPLGLGTSREKLGH